jgi:hypothetical protein
MSGSVFQQGFYGGGKCRISCLASAVQLALHRKSLKAQKPMQPALYKGAIDFSEQLARNSTSTGLIYL